MLQAKIHRKAFAEAMVVLPFDHCDAERSGDGGGGVGAVVSHDDHAIGLIQLWQQRVQRVR